MSEIMNSYEEEREKMASVAMQIVIHAGDGRNLIMEALDCTAAVSYTHLLIDQVPYKGKHAEEITGLLVGRAVDMGYLTDGGTVMVKADGGSARWKQKRESDIGNGLRRQFEGRMEVEIKVGDDAGAVSYTHLYMNMSSGS